MPIAMPPKKQRSIFRPLSVLLALLLLAGVVAVYWHVSGRVNLAGEVEDSVISLSPALPGVFSRIEVREGQRVDKGQTLILLDSTTQRKILAEERQKLAQLEALLPPRYSRASGSGGYGQLEEEESLEERLARQRKEEAAAERRLQSAAADEAQASILYNRAAVLASQGKIAMRERDAAAAALDDAKLAAQAARAAFEAYSQTRSGTVAEMRRIKENQSAIGADALPANLRIKNYELQRERMRAAAAALEGTIMRAPEDGVITEIAAKPGGPAVAGAPCLYMASFGRGVVVVARASDDMAKKLSLKQPCRLEIAGAPENPYTGYISNVLPGSASFAGKDAESAPPGMRVRITVIGPTGGGRTDAVKAAKEERPVLYLNGGARAEVTVFLRAPLHALNEPSESRPDMPEATRQETTENSPAAAPSAASSPSDAPAPAVSSQTVPSAPSAPLASPPPSKRPDGPDGGSPSSAHPPMSRAPSLDRLPDSPESGHPLPQLPPMQAPERLIGSPLPDPRNNPSIVTPEALEREANSER